MLSQPARVLQKIPFTLTALTLIAGCAGQQIDDGAAIHRSTLPTVRDSHTAGDASLGTTVARIAARQTGTPYRYGGSTTSGFDCSGLVHYAYAQAGVSLPRTTAALWRYAQPVARPELRPGDILFFDIDGKVSHVGLYLGGERFVHAPSSGRVVTIARLDSDFYRQAFIRAGRPWKP